MIATVLAEHLYARLAFLQRHRYTENKEGSRRICACRMESFMIRFIITALFVILFLILSIPLLIAEWIIGKFNPPLKDRSSLAIVNWAFPSPTSERIAFRRIPRFSMSVITAAISISL